MKERNISAKLQFRPVYDGSRVEKRGYRKHEAWEEHRVFILGLRQQGIKHKDILTLLADQKNFKATLNQLKSKLELWGATGKNLNPRQRKWIYSTKKRRLEEGKETIFFFGDSKQEVTISQVAAIMKSRESEFPASIVASPGNIEMATPAPAGSSVDEEAEGILAPSATLQPENTTAFDPPSILQSPSPSSTGAIEPEETIQSSPHSPADSSPSGVPPLPSTFEQIYTTMLQSLDLLHLTAAPNDDSAINAEGDGGLEGSGDQSVKRNNCSEIYNSELVEWMQNVYEDAEAFVEAIHAMVLNNDRSFSWCRDAIIEDWIREYDEEPLPYHLSVAIAHGDTLKPVTNGWEDIPQQVAAAPDRAYTRIVQRNVWIPIDAPGATILDDEDWKRIDRIFEKYFTVLERFSNKLAKSDPESHIALAFRQEAAHLQTLRQSFGEFNYFTIASLKAFADVCSESQQVPNRDVLFLYDSALKTFNAIGLTWHESAFYLYDRLGKLRNILKDYSGALECCQLGYMVAEFRWGQESVQAVNFVSEIARYHYKLGSNEDGDHVLAKGLVHIQTAVSKLAVDDSHPRYYLGNALARIAEVYKDTNRKEIANLIGKFALQQYSSYRRTFLTYHDSEDDIAKEGRVPQNIGKAFYLLKDYENAAKMYQTAFNVFATHYGERDRRTMDAIQGLCKSMRRRGLILYTIPILEKSVRISGVPRDGAEEEDRIGFRIWMEYMETVMKVNGRWKELADMRRGLMDAQFLPMEDL